MTRDRVGKKWTVNEVLSLQREYELLGWNIEQIAEKHGRTANGIMYKLDSEGLADYNALYSNYYKLNTEIPEKQISLNYISDDETVLSDNDSEYIDDGFLEENLTLSDESSYENNSMLCKRVLSLEKTVEEIKDMIKTLMANTQNSSYMEY
jgi:hypothetical protein